MTNAKLEEIIETGIIYSENSTQKAIEADNVILALGSVPNKAIAAKLKGKVAELYSVGDCAAPGKILEAVEAGFHRGRSI